MSGISLVTGGMISTTTSADWTDGEKAQIRSALGVNGLKTSIVDSEILDGISALPSGGAIADAVWDEDLVDHNIDNSSGKIMQQIKGVVNAVLGLIS